MTDYRLNGVLNDWELTSCIGQGAFGTVYEAINSKSVRSAIKIISIPASNEEGRVLLDTGDEKIRAELSDVVNSLSSELTRIIGIQHSPNIASVYNFKVIENNGSFGWNVIIRMELLTSLNSYMVAHRLTQPEIIKLGIDACNALNSYSQICSSGHGDIKPENIFVDGYGNFKLGDFGISLILKNRIGDLPQKDSMSYMAPEVMRGKKYDTRADIYSLGVLLYRLLNFNRLPLLDVGKQIISPKERQNAVNRRLMGEKLPAPAEASPELSEIILQACAFNPEDRFVTATAFKNALESISGLEPRKEAVSTPSVNLSNNIPVTQNEDETMSVRRPDGAVNKPSRNQNSYSFDMGNQQQEAKTDSPYDQYTYGKSLYEVGMYPEALKQLRSAAANGVDEAKYLIGRCYYRGYGVPVDYSDAVFWFKEAALSELAPAQYSVGICYYYGQGVEQDCSEAIRWFAKAAVSGYAPAEYSLGECYYSGIGVGKNYEKAVAWARRAADKGYSKAQNALGICYYSGQGVEKNLPEAARWFRLAAQNGNKYAQSQLDELTKLGY
ncbi:MAG: serine/threonine-protein kinase [Oscillospiraceae bacterium]|nr:serine/threonine-protein kinase [Oscillospiraceae bacterium]